MSVTPDDQVVILVGNPAPASRTAVVAAQVARALTSAPGDPTVLDLAALVHLVGGPDDPNARSLRESGKQARVLVVATPVYKAAYTGLLKSFLDGLGPDDLAATVVVPVVVTGSAAHGALADLQLRVVLQALGASLPVPSFVVEEKQLPDLDAHVEEWARRHAGLVTAVAGALEGEELSLR